MQYQQDRIHGSRPLRDPDDGKPFDGHLWHAQFQGYVDSKNYDAVAAMRIDVQQGTIRASEEGQYLLPNGTRVALYSTPRQAKDQICCACTIAVSAFNTTAEAVMMHLEHLNDCPPVAKCTTATKVEVIQGDCLEVAIRLKTKHGLKPLVLNMASARRPGGGYLSGAGAQEENIFRRSNYYMSLEERLPLAKSRDWRYPIPEFSGIYSPQVLVFRKPETDGYAFMDAPVALDFVAVAACVRPKLIDFKETDGLGSQEPRMAQRYETKMKQKIRVILRIALETKHDCLVLSAFGCGAFANPPTHVARLFKEALDGEFKDCFRHVAFAIYDDSNSHREHNPEGNYLPFQRTFQQHKRATPAASDPAMAARCHVPVGGYTKKSKHKRRNRGKQQQNNP